jgi:Tfp pilus assembly protein PilF
MKLKYNFVFALVIINFIIGANFSYAASSWDSLSPNTLYGNFVDAIKTKILFAEHSVLGTVGSYKKLGDTNPVSYEGFTNVGVSKKPATTTGYYDSKSEVNYEIGSGKKGTTYAMNVVTKNNTIYVSFPYAKAKALKGKWILVPTAKYDGMGESMDLPELFDAAVIEAGTEEERILDKSVIAAKQNNLLSRLPDGVDDGNSVEGTTRYDFALNANSLVAYYKAFSKSLTSEEIKKTVLVVPGFEKALSKAGFVNYIADHSYISLWIDNKTQLPTRLLEVTAIPGLGSTKNVTISLVDLSWKNINVPVSIDIPAKNVISYSEGIKALGITESVENDVIKDLLLQLKKAKSKTDKADINYYLAQEYDNLEEYETAASYFRKSATYYKKESPDYYDALAEAEWSLNNGKKVKELYELALKKSPRDLLILSHYGWFLLGISNTSVSNQDLQKALTLNKMLVQDYVDDDTLQNLYINYLMLGQQANADDLKSKFDNFGTGENYNRIARAYHRMGNKLKANEYSELARQAGHVRTNADNRFFSQAF